MEQYIPKSALVAEIKRRMDKNMGKQVLPQYFGMIEEDLNILSFIETLEVKEVESLQENPCDGCTNRKGCITCENGELRETVQEEPVSDVKTRVKEIFDSCEKIDISDVEKNRVAFGLLELEGFAKIFYEMGKQQKEPVSEELEEAASMYAKEEYSRKSPATLPDRCRGCYAPIMYAFKAGAQWQKEQFEKNRLKHCNSITNEQAELEQGFIDQHLDKYQRMPTFLDAIEYGMRLQKQQMTKDATDVTVHIEAGNYPYIPQIELYDYDKDIPLAKEGDKYKVVLIKEE